MNADESTLKPFYFTFANNSNLRNNFVKVMAESYGDARGIMFAARGMCWAFQYDDYEFQRQITDYNLTEVPIDALLVSVR